jgi:hypothetical protein
MNENEVFKKLVTNLSFNRGGAALSNYEVLCNNIKFLNELLYGGDLRLKAICYSCFSDFEKIEVLKDQFKNENNSPFLTVIPRIFENTSKILEKFILLSKEDDRDGITIDNVGELHRDFLDYNQFVTAARQAIDCIVSDSYQYLSLDQKEFNYHVLVSLNSFSKFASKSLKQSLFNSEVDECLKAFERLNFNDWKNSSITKCRHPTFGQKVDYILSQISVTLDVDFKDRLKNLFKFCSEFTHIGYVSTFFTTTGDEGPIFGDDIGPYLLSTENFSELKYEILEVVMLTYFRLYIPSILSSIKKVILEDEYNKIDKVVSDHLDSFDLRYKSRNSKYYFFIKSGLTNSSKKIELPCMCGRVRLWLHPYEHYDLYCKGCGSSFNLLEIDGDGGYVVTGNGPVKVIGSDAPDIHELPYEEREKLFKECQKLIDSKKNTD